MSPEWPHQTTGLASKGAHLRTNNLFLNTRKLTSSKEDHLIELIDSKKYLIWGFKSKAFSGMFVEFVHHSLDFFVSHFREILPFWEELANKLRVVLHRAPLTLVGERSRETTAAYPLNPTFRVPLTT